MISKCYPKSKFKTKHSFRIYSSGQLKWLKIELVNPSWRMNKYLLYFFAKNDSPVWIWLNTTSMVYIYFPLYMQLSESLSIFLHCSIFFLSWYVWSLLQLLHISRRLHFSITISFVFYYEIFSTKHFHDTMSSQCLNHQGKGTVYWTPQEEMLVLRLLDIQKAAPEVD